MTNAIAYFGKTPGCPGQVSGPGPIPFLSYCYDRNSDMGAFLASGAPAFQAEMSDMNIVFRKFGTPPKTMVGRWLLATEGPDLWQQLQASLAALHPLLGKDEVATTMRNEGLRLLATVRHLTPDVAGLQDAIRHKVGEAGATYAPETLKLFANELTREKVLGAVSALVAPLAVKYGGLGRALEASMKAGALAGATVILFGIWQHWVQGRMGEIHNELHATSGTLADKARPPPWEGYQAGDWVFMRELRGKEWKPRIGVVLDAGTKTNRRYKRYAVAILPAGTIAGRESTDMQFMDQAEVGRAVRVDPKLAVWRSAVAVKHFADKLLGCTRVRRRLVQGRPPGEGCAWGPVRGRDPPMARHVHWAGPPSIPPLPEVSEAEWESQRLQVEKKRLDHWKATLEKEAKAGKPVAADRQKFLQALSEYDRRQFALHQKRSQAEQQSIADLSGRGLQLLGSRSNLYAYVADAIVKLTHIDEAGNHWYRTSAGGLKQLPEGQMVVDRDLGDFPAEWRPAPPPIARGGLQEEEEEEGPSVPFQPRSAPASYAYLVAAVILALGILLIIN